MAPDKQPSVGRRPTTSRPKQVGIALLALLATFLLGYVPQYLRARNDRAERDDLAYRLKLADLRGELGMMSYEANRNNYGSVGQLSTPFFDGLRDAIDVTSDNTTKQQLQAILQRRDEITSDLAQAKADVKSKLAQMYADFPRGRPSQ